MRKTLLMSAAVASLAIAMPAFAQTNPVTGARPGNTPGTNNSLPLGNNASNIGASTTHSEIAPRLPAPAVADSASPQQYLAAAKRALGAHHTGEAQQALEMAETRALDRSTVPSAAGVPDSNPLVSQITKALDALSRQDYRTTNQMIDTAMSMASTG